MTDKDEAKALKEFGKVEHSTDPFAHAGSDATDPFGGSKPVTGWVPCKNQDCDSGEFIPPYAEHCMWCIGGAQ